MAQPTTYTKATDFAADERANVGGRATVRTDRVDAELDGIALTLSEILINLALMQRDDGRIRDGFIELYSLSAACRLALQTDIEPRGLWETATEYAAGDLVDEAGVAYLCPTAHTSGTFATDYAAGLWQVFGTSADAGAITFTPPSPMVATDVQEALEELNTRNQAQPLLAASFGAL